MLERIRFLVRQHPFVPFRIYVSDQSHYDVAHQDFAIVAEQYVEITTNVASDDNAPDEVMWIDPFHITRVHALRPEPKVLHSGPET